MSIGSCWLFGFIIVIVLAATINPDLEAVTGSKFGQPMAQIYFDAVGKHGTMGLMSLLFVVQFLMGLSILVAASRQTWAFSRDGALPFSSFFRPISQRFGYIPLRALWGCVLLTAILGLLSLIAEAAAQALFSLVIAGNNLAWGIPIFARLVWGEKKFKPGPFYTGDRFSRPIAWTAIVFLIFGIVLSMFPVGGPDPTRESLSTVDGCMDWKIQELMYHCSGCDELYSGDQLRCLAGCSLILLHRCTQVVYRAQDHA